MANDQERRLARNEAFFRQVNEEIAGENLDTRQEFLCECSDATCTERIELSLREYERIREGPARFVLVRGHSAPEIEFVVEREDEHVVVEKVGAAREVAAELD